MDDCGKDDLTWTHLRAERVGGAAACGLLPPTQASVRSACGKDERADAQRMGCDAAQFQKGEVIVVNGCPGL